MKTKFCSHRLQCWRVIPISPRFDCRAIKIRQTRILSIDYGGLGRFCSTHAYLRCSLVYWYPKEKYISLDSQRRMLNHDIDVVNMSNKIKSQIKREFRNCNFSYIFLNWNISVIIGVKSIKLGTLVVNAHSEGTVSQIFYLGLSFYFMKSGKFSCKKWQKVSRFFI